MYQRFQNLLNSGLDPVDTDPFVLRKYRSINIAALCFFFVTLPFIIRAVQWQVLPRLLVLSIAAIGFLAVLIGLRYIRKPELFGHIITTSLFAIAANGVLTGGGATGIAVVALYLPPLFAALFSGIKPAFIWTGISCVFLIVLHWLENNGLQIPYLTPPAYRGSQMLFQEIAVFVAIFIVAASFLGQLKMAESRLKLQLRALEREVAQRQLAEDKANQANLAKSHFLASMSHELRTPLNAILGFSSRLKKKAEGRLQPMEIDALDRVLSNGEHLLQMINDLLDLAKIESGRGELNLEKVDLSAIIGGVVLDLTPLAEKDELTLTSELPELLFVQGDKKKLRQVFFNILGNAIKYTEKGHVQVSVEESTAHVRVAIKDTGVGIRPEIISTLFDEYTTVENSVAKHVDSTGLGLPLASKLVALHGGTIEVNSQHGVGSTFTVVLPRTPPGQLIAATTGESPGLE